MDKIPFNPQQLRNRCLANTTKLLRGEDGFGAAVTDKSQITYDTYTYIDNGAHILAVAHCDTIKHRPTFSRAVLEGERCYFSPAMDDRLGVYTILDVLPQLGLKYDVLLTNDEEKGMSTANDFRNPAGKKYKWIFEFDRRGTGAVYYQYDPGPIVEASKPFFKKEFGTFSDISVLGWMRCGGINVGTGYYFEHNYYCHMIVGDWADQVSRFVLFYNANKNTYLEHTGAPTRTRSYTYGYGYTGGWDGQDGWTNRPLNKRELGKVLLPEFVKEWIKSITTEVEKFESVADLNLWLGKIPFTVENWLWKRFVEDKDSLNKLVWYNEWIAENIKPSAIVPFVGNSGLREEEKEDDEDMNDWKEYFNERESYTLASDEVLFCDRCGTKNAEYFIPGTTGFSKSNGVTGTFTCGDCDDLLWWSRVYR